MKIFNIFTLKKDFFFKTAPLSKGEIKTGKHGNIVISDVLFMKKISSSPCVLMAIHNIRAPVSAVHSRRRPPRRDSTHNWRSRRRHTIVDKRERRKAAAPQRVCRTRARVPKSLWICRGSARTSLIGVGAGSDSMELRSLSYNKVLYFVFSRQNLHNHLKEETILCNIR